MEKVTGEVGTYLDRLREYVIAQGIIFVFSKVLTSMFQVIGNVSISNALAVLPVLLITFFVCIYGLVKIPELTSAILSGRAGTWVNPMGN